MNTGITDWRKIAYPGYKTLPSATIYQQPIGLVRYFFVDRFHLNHHGTGARSGGGTDSCLQWSFLQILGFIFVILQPFQANGTIPQRALQDPPYFMGGKSKCSLPGSNWRSSDCSWNSRLMWSMRPTLYQLSQGSHLLGSCCDCSISFDAPVGPAVPFTHSYSIFTTTHVKELKQKCSLQELRGESGMRR